MRAARAGLTVPATAWARADTLGPGEAQPPPDPERLPPVRLPFIIRSGSPTEDTAESSRAGQFVSRVVRTAEDYPNALGDVVASLPRNGGRPNGVVFVQPLIEATRAGVTFFDGFYYEETSTRGGNASLTSGLQRGEVHRGHLHRGDPLSHWLCRVHRVFGGRIDLEWAEQEGEPERILLQVRPALFPIRRNETVSLANHKEILGNAPSPWIVGAMIDAGQNLPLRHFHAVEPAIEEWEEPYAIELAGRPWMNFSFFFRLMDSWGLPRTMVTDGVGGLSGGPEDDRLIPWRFVRKLPRIAQVAALNYLAVGRMHRELRDLDRHIERATSLSDLRQANVRGMEVMIRTNVALVQILAVASRIRRWLGIDRAGHVVTQDMMEEYTALASESDSTIRAAKLNDWLARYGHRGPLETDPRNPRFAELRETLFADLSQGAFPEIPTPLRPSLLQNTVGRFLFMGDAWREWLRDQLMRRWQRLRWRILEEAHRAQESGWIDDPDDIFFLRGEDLDSDPTTWRDRAAVRRDGWERTKDLDLPTTASRDDIETLLAKSQTKTPRTSTNGHYHGIGLGTSPPISGTAVRGTDVTELLNGHPLPESPILIAATLEPSWAVVFPRFAAVVAEFGGELSHAAILLREAGIPAVVNVQGAFTGIADGDRVRVDPTLGEIVIESHLLPNRDTHASKHGILNKAN